MNELSQTERDSLEAEIEALRSGCGLMDFSWRPRLVLSGEDRARFLNGQMTCDLRDPQPGEGIYGFFTTAKGRVEADATITFLDDRLVLELPPNTLDGIAERLNKYIIFDQVAIQPEESTAALVLAGPTAHRWLDAQEGSLPSEARHHVEGSCLGRKGRILRRGDLGVEAFSFWVSQNEATDLFRDLASQGEEGPRSVSFRALNSVRIQAGIPWFGHDFGPENLPQETGLDDAVSYEKGCYLGQEIVARLHYRGQVSKQLRRLTFEGPDTSDSDSVAPEPGTALQFEGRAAGQVTSSTLAGEPGTAVGLAMLQRRAFEKGTVLEIVGGGTARVEA